MFLQQRHLGLDGGRVRVVVDVVEGRDHAVHRGVVASEMVHDQREIRGHHRGVHARNDFGEASHEDSSLVMVRAHHHTVDRVGAARRDHIQRQIPQQY